MSNWMIILASHLLEVRIDPCVTQISFTVECILVRRSRTMVNRWNCAENRFPRQTVITESSLGPNTFSLLLHRIPSIVSTWNQKSFAPARIIQTKKVRLKWNVVLSMKVHLNLGMTEHKVRQFYWIAKSALDWYASSGTLQPHVAKVKLLLDKSSHTGSHDIFLF